MQSFGSRFDSARGECGHILPELFPWETSLPWASTTLKENVAVWPEGASPARASACVKAAAASTSRGAGTSAIARSRNAGGRSVAGRRRGGRPNIARPPRSKPGMPRQSASAVSGPSPRPRPLNTQRLRRRVVTRQQLFFETPH